MSLPSCTESQQGPLCTCFTQLSTIQSMSYNQYNDYATSWELFRRVELYNSNVSTQRGNGDSNLNYWQFPTQKERSMYRQGGVLFATYLNFTSTVQKN